MSNILVTGTTRAGKSLGVMITMVMRMLEGCVVFWCDPQAESSAARFFNYCLDAWLPIIRQNNDDLEMDLLPHEFAVDTGDPVLNRTIAEWLAQCLVSDRGMGHASQYVQIMEHAIPFILTKMDTGLRFHQMRDYWYRDKNAWIRNRCRNQECIEAMERLPNSHSPSNRETAPARRLLETLTHGEAVKLFDVGECPLRQMIDDGVSLAIDGGNVIPRKEHSFLLNHTIMRVLMLAQTGQLTRNVYIVLDEAEIHGVSPKLAQAMQSMNKYGLYFVLITQEPKFNDEVYPVTTVVSQNSDHFIFRANSDIVLDWCARDLVGLYDPHMVKRTTMNFRQEWRGYEGYDAESETKSKSGKSETSSYRERPIYKDWFETREDYYNLHEQQALLKKAISRLPVGLCITKIGGEIDTFQFPEINHWVRNLGEHRREKHSYDYIGPDKYKVDIRDRWSIEKNSSQTSPRDMSSQMSNSSKSQTSTSGTSKSPSRPSKEISGHWSKVEISTLSEWLWPESDENDSTEK